LSRPEPANPLDYATPEARCTIERAEGRLLIRLPVAATLASGRIPLLMGVPLFVRLAVAAWLAAEVLLLALFHYLYIGPAQMIVTGVAIAAAVVVVAFVCFCMSPPFVTEIEADAEELSVRTLERVRALGPTAIEWPRADVGDVYLVGQWLRVHARSGNGRWLSLVGADPIDRVAVRDALRREFHIR